MSFALTLGLLALPLNAEESVNTQADALKAANKAVRMLDFGLAFELYQQAAQQGSAEAQYQLAQLYLQGRGTAKNDGAAIDWLERAAEQKHPGAQYALAMQLKASDVARAQSFLQAAADAGYKPAQAQIERAGVQIEPQGEVDQLVLWLGAARANDIQQLEKLHKQGVDVNSQDKNQRTALFVAIESGSDQAVNWLIKNDADVNHRDKFDLSPSQIAIDRAQLGALKQLFKAGAKRDQTLANGDNLLHFAIRKERLRTSEYLIAAGVPLNQKNKEGWTPLDLAEYKNNDALVASLEKKGAKKGDGWQQGRKAVDVAALAEQLKQQSDLPPEALAVANNNVALLEQLIKENPKRLDTELADGSTLLTSAIKQSKTKMLMALIALGADVNRQGFKGSTPLQIAVRRQQEDAVNALLEAGANPLLQDDSKSDAIAAAIEVENEAIALKLFDHLISPYESPKSARRMAEEMNIPAERYLLLATQHHQEQLTERILPLVGNQTATDDLQRNALWFAAKEGNASLVKKLVKAGVDTKQRDNLGLTPFLVAVEAGCLECARQLYRSGSIDESSNSGNTALHIASQNGDSLLAAWLIQKQAPVEIRNTRGNTPIMEAVNAHSMEVVQILIKADANVSRKNKLGFSAIDLAKQVSPEMEALVRSKSVLGIF